MLFLDTNLYQDIMENAKILEDLGLPKQETQAYLALLKLGGSLASTVAKEMSVKRTTVYSILKSLAAKGLVLVYFRKSRKFYYPVQPHKVASLFERKLNAFNDLIPTLQSMEKKQEQIFGVRFIETKEELEEYHMSIIDEYKNLKNKEYYAISNDAAWENLDPEFFRNFRRIRAKNGIKIKLLFSNDSRKTVSLVPRPLQEFKFLPPQHLFTSSIEIHKNKITITSNELNSAAVVIAIKPIVDTFKTIFEILWDLIPEEKGKEIK